MSKLPAFQFYPGDWRKDPGVQSLTFEDRGIWFEILLIMHESEERGKLLLNGSPMPEEALARMLGLDLICLTKSLTTLLTYGVASREPNTGVIFNRRMVRDEEMRKIRSACGKLGGNPSLLNQKSNQTPTTPHNQISTPSSSSSSSSSNTNSSRAQAAPVLDELWTEFKKVAGEANMIASDQEWADARAWNWNNLDFPTKLTAVETVKRRIASGEYSNGYTPGASKYLSKKLWTSPDRKMPARAPTPVKPPSITDYPTKEY